MNISELMTDLIQQGVQFQVNDDKIKISSAQTVLTQDMLTKLSKHKPEILTFLRQQSNELSAVDNRQSDSSLDTIGRLISGFSSSQTSGDYRSPTLDTVSMAHKLAITFRPGEQSQTPKDLQIFSHQLEDTLRKLGVKVVPWKEAIREYAHDVKIPILGWKSTLRTRFVRSEINAVIDLEKKSSILNKVRIVLAEILYFLYTYLFLRGQKISVSKIAMLTGWAEKHVALQLENPIDTQVIMLTEFNHELSDLKLSYQQKIKIGLSTLVRTFSEIVIGVSEQDLSILNMNLSDSTFPKSQIEDFVLNALIPKVFVPILPLSISRFECGQYNPQTSSYAKDLVDLGQELSSTDLFPSGSKLSQVIKRPSHRDLVDVVVNGRTGVSYGFIAYAEPPQYFGKPEITAAEWNCLAPIEGFSPHKVRQDEAERRYIRMHSAQQEEDCFKQVPDIWLVSSRSGANKTSLSLEHDITRIGLKKGLVLQIPQGINPESMDIKPSYDTYVMLAIALSAALFIPELMQNGCPIVHFHGYPSSNWFEANEYCTGVNNPSVPCGTYEAGVLNYLGIQRVAQQSQDGVDLISLIEPDHGTNIIAPNLNYLLDRLKTGCHTGAIKLGGEHFASLKEISI